MAQKTFTFLAVNKIMRGILRVLCRIDFQEFNKVPQKGPLILVCNHVNFLEVPTVFTFLQPRPITGFVKADSWNNPFKKALFNLWDAIPLHRGEPDIKALRKGMAALDQEMIVAITPEGTRSGHGRLQIGHPGVAMLGLHSRAPLLPLVYFGSEKFWDNLPRLKKTDFNVRIGRIFTIDSGGRLVNADMRTQITSEIMYQLAALLPPAYRGYYADLNQATTEFLKFL